MDRRAFFKKMGIGMGALAISGLSRSGWTAPEVYEANPCRIVVFGADGLRYDHSVTLRQKGAPGLSVLYPPMYSLSGGLSCTQPGWASIWSALPSQRIKTWSNTRFRAMPAGMHIMEKLMDAYVGGDFFPVWITGKGHNIMGKDPESPHWAVYRRIVVEKHPGIYHGDEKREDEEVYGLARQALEEADAHEHFCCFIHFANPDHSGHQYKDYDAYMEHAWMVDEYISSLMLIPKGKTDIIYCSDHGFDFLSLGDFANGHSYSPQGMLATNFPTRQYPCVCQHSIGRLVYKLAGGDPDHTMGGESEYKMFGIDLI